MTLARRLMAEGLGTGTLAAAVIGSGIMAERLSGGNAAVALLANTGATVAALIVLIALFGPISGAHFNPVVTIALALKRAHSWRHAGAYVVVQLASAIAGAALAHAMFAMPLIKISTHMRAGAAQCLSEVVATCGLLLVVLGHKRSQDAPWLVAAWIGAAYWFTASTSFANPAITISRALSDTFAGIRPADTPLFIAAQTAGALVAVALSRFLFDEPLRQQ